MRPRNAAAVQRLQNICKIRTQRIGCTEAVVVTLFDGDIAAKHHKVGLFGFHQCLNARVELGRMVQTAVQVTSEQPLTLTGINVPAGGSAVIIYTAQVNGSAPLASGSTIENTVTVTGGGLAEPVTATESVSVSEAPYLTVEKTLSPLTVTSSQRITYTFLISNYGNAPAEADANASITDVLSPVLTGLTATYNGVLWTQGTEYTYSETSGIFTSDPGAITVPAATYTTLPDGTVSTTPGTATLLLEGTVG